MPSMLSLEGRQLGNYDVIRRIRVGGMGAVYEGKQRTAFNRRVAIKVILGNYAADRDMRRRFAREARTVARLHHPHILPLIEYGDEQGILYLVMPFIEGGTLTSYLRRSLPDLNEVSAIYQQLLDAVEYAHDEGLIHRDIKSSNVLLEQRRSGTPHVYLADFGLVRTSKQTELEQAGKPIPLDQVPGTPHYMAPEQTMGIVSTSSDIYALGVLLYQLLTGELPYDDPDEEQVIHIHLSAPIPSPSDHDATIPIELSEVVRTAMAKRVEDRYSSITELRQAFLAAIQSPADATLPIENNLEADEIVPPVGRPISTPLQPFEAPAPMLLVEQRRKRFVSTEALARGRQHATDDVRRNKLRTTEPINGQQRKHRRFTLSIMAVVLVPILLLALLVAPRVMGISLFPVGVPFLGADPTATVTITPQAKNLSDAFILTASPQVSNPDVATRELPNRSVPGSLTDSRTMPTSGSAFVPGAQARGYLLFVNSGDSPAFVPAGITFTTTLGVPVQTTQAVEVPPQQEGQNGTSTASAVAVNAGSIGNIPVNTLARRCCHGLFVSNPDQFSGGVDAHLAHAIAQADIDGVSGQLSSELQQRELKQLLNKMRPGEVMAQQPVYRTTVTSDNPVGSRANQVTVQVTVTTTVFVYNRSAAGNLAIHLLNVQAHQTLGNSYLQQGTPTVGIPRVVQQGKNGLIYLSVPVHEVWTYSFSTQQFKQWKQSIRGATVDAALAYLNAQGGVQAVQIHLPFGTDHFPSTVDQIKIMVV